MPSTTLPKKVLIAVSSAYTEPFYPDGSKTGTFYTEISHPYKAFVDAGFTVDLVSENGKSGFDKHSISTDYLSQKELDSYEKYEDEFNIRKIVEKGEGLLTAKNVDPSKYGIFFAAGGHGACFDFPKATGLHNLADKIYQKGGIVSAVCHGPEIFKNLKSSSTNEYLIKGIKITGFTDEGEKLIKVDEVMKKLKFATCAQIAKEQGAIYVKPKGPWDDFSIEDKRIVTGPNPASATSTAKLAIKTFNSK